MGKPQQKVNNKHFTISTEEVIAILETAVEGIVTIDLDGIVRLFNPAAEVMFGYDAREVIGQNVNMLMPEPHDDQHNRFLSHYLDTGKKRIIGIGREVMGKRKDGQIFPLDLSVSEVNVDGKRSFAGVLRDITERKEMETALRQHAEHLAHYDRVDMMGEFAAGIAHEINQPLTAIATYAQACRRLIESDQDDKQEVSEALETISQQAERAGEVIRRLRNMVKRTDSQRKPHDINKLIGDAFRLAKLDTRTSGLDMRLDLQDDLPQVEIDAIQIQQVILNLIRNAVDALSDHPAGEQCVIVKTELGDDEKIVIIVTDNGVGIPPDIQHDLFNPFFTTKEKGMGIGLSISQSIVTAHGGKLWFESEPDKGSSFYVSLPCALTPNDQ